MAKRLQANDLNRKVAIQKKGRTEDEAGYPIPNPKDWEDVFPFDIWAKRVPLRGRDFFAANAAQSEITVRYEIRYRQGITSDMRLVDKKDGRIYEIKVTLDDVYDDGTETHLMVAEASSG